LSFSGAPGESLWRAAGPFLALQAAAFWPVWVWLTDRLLAQYDEPLGLIPLFAALAWIATRPPSATIRSRPASLIVPTLLTLLYAAAYPWPPFTVRAWLAMLALGSTLGAIFLGTAAPLSLWGLLLLSPQIIIHLQFYLGYPLRVFSGALAAGMLRLNGFAVEREGAVLRWGDALVWVDAPCSGAKMLWTGLCLAFAMACFLELNRWRTLAAALAAGVVVILANGLRTASLFFLETGIFAGPAWMHDATGLAVFAGAAGIIAFAAWTLARGQRGGKVVSRKEAASARASASLAKKDFRGSMFFAVACAVAGLTPFFVTQPSEAPRGPEPAWPTEFEGLPLWRLPLTEAETRFMTGFPGHIARFANGHRTVVLRWIEQPTRHAHPADRCYQAMGYGIDEREVWVDPAGVLWGRFQAFKTGERLRLRERIADPDGNSWTDLSSWHWDAFLRRTRGPWMAMLVAERAETP
jgi:exosortase/archaeosortase family protein